AGLQSDGSIEAARIIAFLPPTSAMLPIPAPGVPIMPGIPCIMPIIIWLIWSIGIARAPGYQASRQAVILSISADWLVMMSWASVRISACSARASATWAIAIAARWWGIIM